MKVERIVTSGIFSLDGKDYEVDNNVWLVGDDERVVIIDAPHDAGAIVAAVGGRTVDGIVCTHGHNDHINAAVELAETTGAPIALHPDDRMLWDVVHPNRRPDIDLAHGDVLQMGGTLLQVWHTPGHSPGGVCLQVDEAGVVFTGDTLFQGGPGATGRSYSDFPTIIDSIRDRLLTLPPGTKVLTGHGDSTTIGAEAPHLQEWITRGH
jgi:glyoxylase-like metal-dependent hydrolase (beta-lactamase superfamily II)